MMPLKERWSERRRKKLLDDLGNIRRVELIRNVFSCGFTIFNIGVLEVDASSYTWYLAEFKWRAEDLCPSCTPLAPLLCCVIYLSLADLDNPNVIELGQGYTTPSSGLSPHDRCSGAFKTFFRWEKLLWFSQQYITNSMLYGTGGSSRIHMSSPIIPIRRSQSHSSYWNLFH